MSVYNYQSLDEISKRRYEVKLEICCLKTCPYMLPEDCWENDPSTWPAIEYPEIYEYLINTPGPHSREAMKNRKSLEAYNYFISGWVQTVLLFRNEASPVAILKSQVRPSQRVGSNPHCPWVAINKLDDSVVTAHCDCMAGLGESCSHIAALLFKVEAAVRSGYTLSTCTDKACKWNEDFVHDIKSAPISEVRFYTDGAIFKVKCKKRPRMDLDTHLDNNSLLTALGSLDAKPVVLSCFSEHCSDFASKKSVELLPNVPPCLRNHYNVDNTEKSWEDIKDLATELFQKVDIPTENRRYIENLTVKQSGCALWYEVRAGRITASTAHDVLRTDIEKPSESLILKITQVKRLVNANVPALQWGRENESVAIEEFRAIVSESHVNFQVMECGVRFGGQNCFIGATPDSTVSCECHPPTVPEVKCPYSIRHSKSLIHALQDVKSDFCLDYQGNLKKDHRYYTQVQIQMMVFETDFSYFVVWTPNWVHITKVAKDNSFISCIVMHLKEFYCRHILPEILTRKLEYSRQRIPATSTPELLCFCQKPYDLVGSPG